MIALLLSLLTTTVSFSQTTYPQIVNDTLILLTSDQLKHTNLIFAEHKMLLEKTDLLESQTQQYKKLIANYEYNDSVNSELLEVNKKLYIKRIDALNDSLKKETKKRKLSQLGMFGAIGIALIAILFIK
jgi:hypothetical protein